MAQKVYLSFQHNPDNCRVEQLRNMGNIEANNPVSDNEWETVTKGGDAAIEKWIADQMFGRSCTVVLIGTNTAGRKWINYEIAKTWEDDKGILGIYIHNLKDREGKLSRKGHNPFMHAILDDGNQTKLSSIVKAYDPPYVSNTYVLEYIQFYMERWIEEAIRIRKNWPH